MKITRGDLRSIIREMLLREQDETSCDRLLAAVLASESPDDPEGMRAVYDVIQTRANYGFKGLQVGDIAAQITAKGQFSGYNRFNNPDDFINYYSGNADYSDDDDHVKRGASIEYIKSTRAKQFNRACEAIKKGPKGTGATHFVNPARASTGNKWWEVKYDPEENTGFIKSEVVGDHIFGWEMSVRQAREAHKARSTD